MREYIKLSIRYVTISIFIIHEYTVRLLNTSR